MRRLFLIWKRPTKKYYRLWDIQEKRYLLSCYNAYGLTELLDQFLKYIEPQLDPSDADDMYSWESLKICPEDYIINRIEAWGYDEECRNRAFMPICKRENLLEL